MSIIYKNRCISSCSLNPIKNPMKSRWNPSKFTQTMVVAGCDVFGGIFLDFFEHGSAMVRCSIEQREECLWDAALFALWNITWIWHLGCAFWCSLLYLGLSAKQSQLSAAVSSCQQLSDPLHRQLGICCGISCCSFSMAVALCRLGGRPGSWAACAEPRNGTWKVAFMKRITFRKARLGWSSAADNAMSGGCLGTQKVLGLQGAKSVLMTPVSSLTFEALFRYHFGTMVKASVFIGTFGICITCRRCNKKRASQSDY